MDRPSIVKAALIGGATFGLLGSLPIIGALNCFCCALVLGGGFVAAYLHANDCKKLGLAFGAREGATVGLVAGVFYAIVNAIITGLFAIVVGRPDPEKMLEAMERYGVPPEMLDSMEQALELMTSPVGVLIQFAVVLFAGLVFSTVGGLIGGSVFKSEAAPPASPSGNAPTPPVVPPAGGPAAPGGDA